MEQSQEVTLFTTKKGEEEESQETRRAADELRCLSVSVVLLLVDQKTQLCRLTGRFPQRSDTVVLYGRQRRGHPQTGS